MGSRELNSGIDQDVSGAGTITGLGMDLRAMSGLSIHLIWSGTLVGTPALEAHNDPAASPNDWVTVSTVTFEALGGAAGKSLIEISGMRSKFYRVVVPISSGSGHIKVVAHGKGDG